MMIPFLTGYYEEGYLPSPSYDTLPAFFPNCNLALKRALIEDIGLYNEERPNGEDVDICWRASRKGWALYYEPNARCHHEPRRTMTELITQWLRYGYYSPKLFKDFQKARVELFIHPALQPKMAQYQRWLKLDRFPLQILVFLSGFTFIHLMFFLSIICLLVDKMLPATLFFLFFFGFALHGYFQSPIRKLSMLQASIWLTTTYLINISCMLGCLAGSLKNRYLFFSPGV